MNVQTVDLGATQDYWLQVMTVNERAAVGEIVGYRKGESVLKALRRRLAYVAETKSAEIAAHQLTLQAGS